MTDPSSSTPQMVKPPLFEVGNYEGWRKEMVGILTSQKLWDIVEKGYVPPKDANELANWENDKKNKYRKAQNENANAWKLIKQAVDKELLAKVLASDESKKYITAKLRSSDQKRKAPKPYIELIEEVLREPHMMELVVTSHDVWKMLKTYSDNPKVHQPLMSHKDLYPELELKETARSRLFEYAMRGDWNNVIEIYTRKSVAHCEIITNSGDTALHMAIIDAKEDIVEQLVNLMSLEEAEKALRVKNEQGNTPLHLAAFVGNAKLCDCIARKVYEKNQNSKNKEVKNDQNTSNDIEVEKDKNSSKKKETNEDQNSSENKEDGCEKVYILLFERNKENETPLFLAAVQGKTDAFLRLHHYDLPRQDISYHRGNKGDTLLHVAISGEYFDLAFYIIHFYPKLVNFVNERGMSPLHCLASKYTAFRSGFHLRPYYNIIYHCTIVDQLKKKKYEGKESRKQRGFTNRPSQNGNHHRCPDNYGACFHFFTMVYRAFIGIAGIPRQVKRGEVLLPTTSQAASHDTNNSRTPIFKSLISWLKKVLGAGGEEDLGSAGEGRLVPPNYGTILELLKLGSKALLVILGLGSMEIRKIQLKKEKHTWSVQVLNELLRKDTLYKYESSGSGGGNPKQGSNHPVHDAIKPIKDSEIGVREFKLETPILMAARNGITEIMEKILDKYSFAIHDLNSHKENVVLLAVQNRQPHVYQLLLNKRKKRPTLDRIFRQVDDQGNSARHLAASTIGDYKPWRIPGAALQLQWEIKWYKYVKYSMPQNFFPRLNSRSETPKEIFNKSHQELVKSGGEWLTNTSQSCSVVAALIATVAFATSATVPGGNVEGTGTPILENQALFKVFAVSSLVALCFSVTSVIMFLAILTSRYEAKDFGEDLPTKVLLGLTSLFVSIAAILVCFCSGHFFVLSDELKFAAFPLYGVTCLPVTFFAIAQFPLYIDLVRATLATVPQRRYMAVAAEKDDNSSPRSDGANQPPSKKSPMDQGNGGKPAIDQSTEDKTSPNQETNPGTQSKP